MSYDPIALPNGDRRRMTKRKDPKNKAASKRKGGKPFVAGLDPVISETKTTPAGTEKDLLKVQAKTGRPSKYSPELVDAICLRIAEGESMRAICQDENMPAKSTVLDWLSKEGAFRTRYAQARELQADALVEECLEIADDGRNDWMERFGKDGESLGWTFNGEAAARSRIRLEQRRWWASKIAPKKYGEKLDVTSDNKALRPSVIERVIVESKR